MKNELLKLLVIPDAQVPDIDRLTYKAVLRYVRDERWDKILLIGDWMDFPQISRWTLDKPEQLSKSLAADYRIGNELLDQLQDAARFRNANVTFDITLGNHDIRPELFAEKFPQMKGLIEIERGLRLEDRGFKVTRSYPDGELLKIGKAYFHHGLYTSANHPKKMVDNFGVNVFYGHTHDVQSHSKVLWGKDKTIVGQSLGCICRYDMDYVGTNPTNWSQAVTTFYFRPDGYFNYYVSSIFNHKFTAPNGKTYVP